MGITQSELPRLNVGVTVVRRMLDANHSTRTEKMQAAFEASRKHLLTVYDDATESLASLAAAFSASTSIVPPTNLTPYILSNPIELANTTNYITSAALANLGDRILLW